MDSFNVTIGQDRKQVFINVYYNNRRYRFWNGKAIEIKLRCADNPQLLKAAFQLKLREGWRPQQKKKIVEEVPLCVIKALKQGVRTITFKNKIYFNENQSFTKCSLNNCG